MMDLKKETINFDFDYMDELQRKYEETVLSKIKELREEIKHLPQFQSAVHHLGNIIENPTRDSIVRLKNAGYELDVKHPKFELDTNLNSGVTKGSLQYDDIKVTLKFICASV